MLAAIHSFAVRTLQVGIIVGSLCYYIGPHRPTLLVASINHACRLL